MIIRRNSLVSVPLALVALALSSRPTPAPGCSFSEPTLFVTPYAPDTPPARYVAGELGVLQPTWIRAYLVVAYLDLAGIPLTAGERRAAVSYLEGPTPPGTAGLDAWTKARDAATGAPGPQIETERSVGYTTYVNCGDDAFRQAAETLASYEKTYGPGSAETRDWIDAQNAVFWSCGGGAPRDLPALPEGAPAARRADRAYQIAASSFYAGRLEEARKAFEEIASDAGSRWRNLAPYLAARAVLRQATLAEEPAGPPGALRGGADALRVPRRSLSRIRGFARPRPISSASSTSGSIPPPASRKPPRFSSVLFPTRSSARRSSTTATCCFAFSAGVPTREPTSPDPKDDLTSWVVAFQDPAPRGLERALAGFSRTPSLPWIVAVLSKIPASHPRAAEVVEAARRLPGGRRGAPPRRLPPRAPRDRGGAHGGGAGAGGREPRRSVCRGRLGEESLPRAQGAERGDVRGVRRRRAPRRRLARLARGGRPEVRRLHARRPEPPAPPRRSRPLRRLGVARDEGGGVDAPRRSHARDPSRPRRRRARLRAARSEGELGGCRLARGRDARDPRRGLRVAALRRPRTVLPDRVVVRAPRARPVGARSRVPVRRRAAGGGRRGRAPRGRAARGDVVHARGPRIRAEEPERPARAGVPRAGRARDPRGLRGRETRSLSKAAFGTLTALPEVAVGDASTKYWFEGRGWYPPAPPRKSPPS